MDLDRKTFTSADQDTFARLSGDRNPLHRDPAFARMVGFPRPILHGLCSYGTACRAVLSTLADYQPERIKQFDVRFSKPVFPGETLVVEMWQDGATVSYRASVKERPESATVIPIAFDKLPGPLVRPLSCVALPVRIAIHCRPCTGSNARIRTACGTSLRFVTTLKRACRP